ncbi:septum formation initiator family protein [Candidatus Bipolaricaulota bacterium]|nr:septum formation initiator family protein [Candidatus Bipolaricaulota bacterium]
MGAGASSKEGSNGSNVFKSRAISVLLIVAILVVGFLGWIYWNRFQEILELQAEIAELENERSQLRKDISSLREEVSKRNELSYIERLAKEELGFVYPSDEDS